ncbi:methyltransferase domain-containing protein [Bradyrhizobium sp. ARR65]|uniref:class I SAM-dependent methyltransferase n=1 Tax=Bradyrhizobium sp. ARR65 TaxID=1040989 RepID=UPI0012F8CB63|nr:methyltransferase domain-containing protein [Bradyrhizobium sp. ARR65]
MSTSEWKRRNFCMNIESYTTTYTRPVDIKKLDFIHRHLTEAGVRRVLELGCGTGPIAMSLVAKNWQVKGIDVSAECVEVARSHGVDAQVGDAATFREGAPYDAVIMADVLTEVVTPPESLLANAAANLRLGGLLLASTSNGYGWFELTQQRLNPRAYLRRNNTLRRLLGYDPYVRADGERQQWYTRQRVLNMAKAAGFELFDQQNSDFMDGSSSSDIRLADWLPYWAVSGWYFAFHRAR